jgi:hypothetical protein
MSEVPDTEGPGSVNYYRNIQETADGDAGLYADLESIPGIWDIRNSDSRNYWNLAY